MGLSIVVLFACPLLAIASDMPGHATIRGRAGASEIVITTTSRLAGAIDSLRWDGVEFVDSTDHGRQIQSAANFNLGRVFIPEVFNPTEAGSRRDGVGPSSSSRLLRIESKGDELRTVNQPAFWLAPGEKSDGHLATNTTVLSRHRISKRVKIGHGSLPHVIEYDVTFTVPDGEHHTFAQFEAVTGYMPARFSTFLRFVAKTGKLSSVSDGPGEQSDPLVFATADGNHAMGVYSPDQPSPGYETAGYGRFRFLDERVVKWNCVFRTSNPKGIAAGDYRFRAFVIVGQTEDVRSSLVSLYREHNQNRAPR